MSRWQRLCSVAVPISLAVGIAFDFLPRNWIELRLGVDPDGGNGLLESLLILLPIAAAVSAATFVCNPRKSAPLRGQAESELPSRD
jgi:hypothetical protein